MNSALTQSVGHWGEKCPGHFARNFDVTKTEDQHMQSLLTALWISKVAKEAGLVTTEMTPLDYHME